MSVLAKLVQEDFGIKNETERWLKARKHDSLVVDKQHEKFYWNSVGLSGGLVEYLIFVRGFSKEQANNFLRENGYLNYLQTIPEASDEQEQEQDESLVKFFYEAGKDNRDYFYRRNLTDATIDRFMLGYYNGWYSIPYYKNDRLLNIELRRDIPSKQIKQYYANVGQVIFNVDILNFVNTVFITEGSIDALNLIQVGLPAISSFGIIRPRYYFLFVNVKKIFILFDNDSGGMNMALATARRLGVERCYIYCFEDFEKKGYDPVDYFRDGGSKADLLKIVNSKSRKAYQIVKKP